MKPAATAILVALLLAGCAVSPLPVIDVVLHIRDSETLHEEYRALGGKVPKIYGFSMDYPGGGEIWLLPTATIDDLAHELRHIYEKGSWHD